MNVSDIYERLKRNSRLATRDKVRSSTNNISLIKQSFYQEAHALLYPSDVSYPEKFNPAFIRAKRICRCEKE